MFAYGCNCSRHWKKENREGTITVQELQRNLHILMAVSCQINTVGWKLIGDNMVMGNKIWVRRSRHSEL
jgi:hypothetical protein